MGLAMFWTLALTLASQGLSIVAHTTLSLAVKRSSMETRPCLIFQLTAMLIHMAAVNQLLNSWYSRIMPALSRMTLGIVFTLVLFVQLQSMGRGKTDTFQGS
jgi:hypothetical protein